MKFESKLVGEFFEDKKPVALPIVQMLFGEDAGTHIIDGIEVQSFPEEAGPVVQLKIAFASDRYSDEEIFEGFVMNVDGSNVVSLGQQGFPTSWGG